MEYKEKVKLAEDLIRRIEQGEKLEDLKKELLGQGINTDDLYGITASVKKGLARKYTDEIKELVVSGKRDEIGAKFSFLGPDELTKIQEKTIKDLHRPIAKQAVELQKSGLSNQEIVAKLKNSYTSEAEIIMMLVHASARKAEKESNNRKLVISIFIGLLMVAAGIGLTLSTDRIWYGLILGGLVVMGGGAFTK